MPKPELNNPISFKLIRCAASQLRVCQRFKTPVGEYAQGRIDAFVEGAIIAGNFEDEDERWMRELVKYLAEGDDPL